MEEDIPVHLRSVAYYALIPTCGDKDSYRRFLKAFRYSTVKSGRVAHWSAAAWIDPPPWPRPPGSGRCFSADPEPTAPAPLSGAPRSRHQGGVYASGQPQVTIRGSRCPADLNIDVFCHIGRIGQGVGSNPTTSNAVTAPSLSVSQARMSATWAGQ